MIQSALELLMLSIILYVVSFGGLVPKVLVSLKFHMFMSDGRHLQSDDVSIIQVTSPTPLSPPPVHTMNSTWWSATSILGHS